MASDISPREVARLGRIEQLKNLADFQKGKTVVFQVSARILIIFAVYNTL